MPEFTMLTGPLFDGRAERITEGAVTSVQAALAQEAVNRIRQRLHDVLQHPTGRYESSIQTEMQADDVAVTDGGIIYGPWLEGTGSRNYPVTRFPGYHTFREVGQEMEAAAGPLADRALGSAVAEMNA